MFMLSRKWHAGTASVLASGLLQFLEADLRQEQGLSLPASPRPETDATYMGQNKRRFNRSLRPLRVDLVLALVVHDLGPPHVCVWYVPYIHASSEARALQRHRACSPGRGSSWVAAQSLNCSQCIPDVAKGVYIG